MTRHTTRSALITGGAGFIGSHLAEALVAEGWQVTALDDLSSGSEANLRSLIGNQCFQLEHCSISNENLTRLLKGMDRVYHLAAMVSVPLSMEDPQRCWCQNVESFALLLDLLRSERIPVIYASSAAVYGPRSEGLRREDEVPMPLSPYGASKAINEIQAGCFWRAFSVPTVGLRFFNVYGPRQTPNGTYASVIPKFCDALVHGRQPVIYGDGEQSRDFISVKDIARLMAMLDPRSPALAGHVFNVASGRSTTVNQVLSALAGMLGHSVDAVHCPPRPGDIPRSNADTSSFRAAFGDFPFTPIEQGLAETWQWYKDNETC